MENDRKMYAMYLRKSRVDLELEAMGEGETLERHRKMLFALAAKNDILPDQIVIYHELVSGDSIAERPEMQRLLQDVYDQKYAAVLVTEIERLARGNTKDQGEVADAFQTSNTFIMTPSKIYDPQNDSDQEYFEFGLFMSRREFKTIKRRLQVGKDQAAKEGNYLLPVPPYGFEIVKKSKKDRYLVALPDQAPIVKMIFNWYTEDRKTTSWIAKQLTDMGILSPTKQPEWTRQTIADILQNAHYKGVISWGEKKSIKVQDPVTGKMVRRAKRTGNTQYYPGKHKGIISAEQFDKAQSIYGSNAPAKVNNELANPFAGVLRCIDCGRSMGFLKYPDSYNREPRIQHQRTKLCKKKSVSFAIVTEAVIAALHAVIADFELKMESNHSNDEAIRHQERIKAMYAELAKHEKRRRKLFDSWESEDGMYTKEEFIERKLMYNTAIDGLKAQIKEAETAAPVPVDYEERITTLHRLIDCLSDPTVSAREKNIFLKQIVEKITFDSIDNGHKKGATPVLNVHLK